MVIPAIFLKIIIRVDVDRFFEVPIHQESKE